MQDIKFTKFNNQIWEDRNIKGYEKLVLIYLISYNNETFGYSFPTRKQIQRDVGISESALSKALDSLIAKGYITKQEHISKTGRNNIYYIHKYLVVSKTESDSEEAPADAKTSETDAKSEKPSEKDAKTDAKASTNELLVKERVKLRSKMTDLIREQLNELDTDILIKAIDRANSYKPEGYYIGYLLNAYDSVKNIKSEPQREAQDNKPSNNSSSNRKDNRGANTKPLSRYHGTFNEHFRNYSEDELERKLLENQNKKRKGLAQ